MSEITELAAGTVTASDEITVQLVDNIEVSKRDGPETALYELVRISLSVFDNFSLEARAAVVRECAEPSARLSPTTPRWNGSISM